MPSTGTKTHFYIFDKKTTNFLVFFFLATNFMAQCVELQKKKAEYRTEAMTKNKKNATQDTESGPPNRSEIWSA